MCLRGACVCVCVCVCVCARSYSASWFVWSEYTYDGDSFGVNSTGVGVLAQAKHIGLGGLLQRQDSSGLEADVLLHVLSDLENQTIEGKVAQKTVRRLPVRADLAQGG